MHSYDKPEGLRLIDLGVTFKIGSAVARLVAMGWLRAKAPELGRNATVGELIRARIPDKLQQRIADRQFQKLADELSASMQPLLESEFSGLPDNEKVAAAIIVSDALEAVANEGAHVLFATDLDAGALKNRCRSERYKNSLDELIPAGQAYAEMLLSEACERAVVVFVNLPMFGTDAFREILRRERELLVLVEQALARIPAYTPSNATEAFTTSYLRSLKRRLDRLELFGVSSSQRFRQYEITVSYLSLSVALVSEGNDADRDDITADIRAEQALESSSRIVIRGEAGSGKTTLLQWIAVSAATGRLSFVGTDIVPIFVRLREYASAGLPAPEEMLASVVPNLLGEMPIGWVHELLKNGRALVLIDGVDELPDDKRPRVHRWLTGLIADFPLCRFVVSSRPPAVGNDWLSAHGFVTYDLLPMSIKDIDTFIEKWHDAVGDDADSVEVLNATAEDYQQQLKIAIHNSHPLLSLASNPLMCALLCALNRDRRAQLPEDRMELYRIALEMLLERRDKEREIPGASILPRRVKELVLQDLAFWMILNGTSDVTAMRAGTRIELKLRSIRNINMDSRTLLQHLLIRSGLLREPTTGKVGFVHRTFQEYLGAKQAIDEQHIDLLVDRAKDDQWREVIVLASGHASKSQREELLIKLIEKGNAKEEFRHKLHLLAIACLETSPELDPAVAQLMSSTLEALVPPRNFKEAADVASGGDLVLQPLERSIQTRRNVNTECASIRSLALIGGSRALTALGVFSDETRLRVVRELLSSWPYFDIRQYAEVVLRNVAVCIDEVDSFSMPWRAELSRMLHVKDHAFVPGLPFLDRLDGVVYDGPADQAVIETLASCGKLRRLVLNGFGWSQSNLNALGQIPTLRSLKIDVDGEMTLRNHLAGIGKIVDLRIEMTPDASLDIDGLDELGRLETLTIIGGEIIGQAIASRSLAELVLRDCRTKGTLDLAPLNSSRLIGLSVDNVRVAGLAELNDLVYLAISNHGGFRNFTALGDKAKLAWMFLGPENGVQSLSGIEGFEHLEVIAIDRCPNLKDYSSMGALPKLRSVYLFECYVPRSTFGNGYDTLTDLTLDNCDMETGVAESLRNLGFEASNDGPAFRATR